MKFYNKAITLQKLKVKNAIIPPFIFFKVKKYIKQSDKVISEIKKKFKNKKIIIRSSSVNEDTILTSNAGLFESVANVSLNTYDIANGIQKVIRSYKKNKLEGFVTDSDEWHYHNHQHINPKEYGKYVQDWIQQGAMVIGGCCRTTTDHIKVIRDIVDNL